MMLVAVARVLDSRKRPRSNEQGWALLGLLLALGVMSIVLASAIVPNVQIQVQRDKEVEMRYRGEQMAQGIARYYGRGSLVPLQVQLLLLTSPYGPLTELEKLREGVTVGVREIKFVRASATIDPMNNSDWEPIRAGDPRIMRFLQAWLVETQTVDTRPYSQYFLIAGQSQKSVFKNSDASSSNQPSGSGASGPPTPPNPVNPGNPQVKPPGQKSDDDDDDDDDDDVSNDPLTRLLQSGKPGHSNAPIVGVAPKRKGKAANAYFGLDNYEDWVFIYIRPNLQQIPGNQQRPGQPIRPPRISQ